MPGKVIFDTDTTNTNTNNTKKYVEEDPKTIRGEIIMLGRLVPFCGEDVGGGIMKLEDIRWKTLMWGEEGRRKREMEEGLGERERVWEEEGGEEESDAKTERGWAKGDESEKMKEDTPENEDEHKGVEKEGSENEVGRSETASSHHNTTTTTDPDETDQRIRRALTSSYHRILERLALNASDHQSYLSSIRSQDTNLSLPALEERDNDEHERLINATTYVEKNDDTKAPDPHPESSTSDVEDIYNWDYHQLSDVSEERTSQYTKSRPSNELSLTGGQSPVQRKKIGSSPLRQTIPNHNRTHSVRLTKSNLARLLEGPNPEGESEIPSTSTAHAITSPLETLTPFALTDAISTSKGLVNPPPPAPSQVQPMPPHHSFEPEPQQQNSQAASGVAVSLGTQSLHDLENALSSNNPVHISKLSNPPSALPSALPSIAPSVTPSVTPSSPPSPPPPSPTANHNQNPNPNTTTTSLQSWENFTISTTPSESIRSSWREATAKERYSNGVKATLGLVDPLVVTYTSSSKPGPGPGNSGRSTPRLRRTTIRLPTVGEKRVRAVNGDIYLRNEPEQIQGGDESEGSGLEASVFGELAAGVVHKEEKGVGEGTWKGEGKGKGKEREG